MIIPAASSFIILMTFLLCPWIPEGWSFGKSLVSNFSFTSSLISSKKIFLLGSLIHQAVSVRHQQLRARKLMYFSSLFGMHLISPGVVPRFLNKKLNAIHNLRDFVGWLEWVWCLEFQVSRVMRGSSILPRWNLCSFNDSPQIQHWVALWNSFTSFFFGFGNLNLFWISLTSLSKLSTKIWVVNEYMKGHTFEVRRKIWIYGWSLQLYTQLEQLWN